MKRLEIKVIEPLTLYGSQCKQAKVSIHVNTTARAHWDSSLIIADIKNIQNLLL